MKRILSVVLSLVMAFSIISGMDVSVFAISEFENHAKYLAELTFNGEYIHYDYLKRFQFDMPAASEYMVEATEGTEVADAFLAWDGICAVAKPSGVVEKLDIQQQYEAMIYSVVLETLSGEEYIDFTYENALSNSMDFINLLSETANGALLYDKNNLTADDKLVLKECANKLVDEASSKWGALAEYTSIVGEIGDIVDSILEISVSTVEIIDRTSALIQLTETQNYVISYLQRLKSYASNNAMVNAVQVVIENVAGSTKTVVSSAVLDVTFSLGVVASKFAVDFLYGELCVACPVLGAVVFGLNAGIAVSDLLFARSQEVEQYAHMKKFTELMTASRTALRYSENSCEVNITCETASEWVFGIDFVYNVYISNQNCAIKYYETITTAGLVQKVKSLFDESTHESYENYKNTVETYNDYYRLTLNAFHNFWVCDFSEDYPETYDDYVNIRGGDYDVVIPTVAQVNFMKTQFEIAMNQTVNIPAIVYPATSVEDELTYSSSNTNVISVESDGTITPVGEGTANVIATSSNGVKGFCEITVYPYNVSENDVGYTIEKYTGSSSLVEIPSEINGVTVTSLGKDTFGSSGVSVINVPDTITNINIGTFGNCYNLTAINVDENNTRYFSDGGVLFDEEKTNLIKYPEKKDADDFTIPSTVTVIDSGAFRGSNITGVCIPNGVVKIGSDCFRDCENLKNIVVPNSVNNIGSTVFAGCVALESAVLPESVENVGDGVFADCISLESVVLPNNITTLGTSFLRQVNAGDVEAPCSGFFTNCQSLKNVTIPDSVTSLGMYCFSCCFSLTTIELPASVSEINGFAFDLMQIESIQVDENSAYFSSDNGVLFNKDKTKLVRCPEGKTGTYKIPSTVTTLASHAFYYCDSLTSIELPPNKIKSDASDFGSSPFDCCYGITDIIRRKNNFATLGMLWSRIKSSCDNLRTVICLDEFTPEAEYNAIFAYKFNSYDLDKKFFVTDDLMLENLDEYIIDVDLELKPNNSIYYGTGSIIKSGDNEYNLIVKNDINGDGVCNVLDTFDVERVSNGHIELLDIYAIAADSNSDNKVDENDYQSIVNKALGS